LTLPGLALGYLFACRGYIIPLLNYGPRHSKERYFWTGAYNLTDELITTLIILGLLFIGFSKLKNENELTQKLRLNGLYWSVLINCGLITGCWIIQGLGALFKVPVIKQNESLIDGIIVYDFFILLFIFVVRFYCLLYRSKKDKASKSLYFLPYKPYNLIGRVVSALYIIIALVALVSAITSIKYFVRVDINAVIFIGFPPVLLIWIWSKEKNENELVGQIRLKAMQIAVYANYFLFLIATWVIYGIDYWIVLFTGLISVPIVFILVFYFQRYRLRKSNHVAVAPNL
jgi:heme/copper-type cytochrome/quinol oxidase subunit 2